MATRELHRATELASPAALAEGTPSRFPPAHLALLLGLLGCAPGPARFPAPDPGEELARLRARNAVLERAVRDYILASALYAQQAQTAQGFVNWCAHPATAEGE